MRDDTQEIVRMLQRGEGQSEGEGRGDGEEENLTLLLKVSLIIHQMKGIAS